MVLGLCAVRSERRAPEPLPPTFTDIDLSNAVLDSGTSPEVSVRAELLDSLGTEVSSLPFFVCLSMCFSSSA